MYTDLFDQQLSTLRQNNDAWLYRYGSHYEQLRIDQMDKEVRIHSEQENSDYVQNLYVTVFFDAVERLPQKEEIQLSYNT